MLNPSRFLIISRSLASKKFNSLFNISLKSFAAKNKDGAGLSDKEVDKTKKTVKVAAKEQEKTTSPVQEAEQVNTTTANSTPVSNILVIESIPGDKV